MELYTAIVCIALVLSIASISVASYTLYKMYRYVETLIDELGYSLIVRRRHRRVKRYILVKFICPKEDFEMFSSTIKQRIYSFIGPLMRNRCSIDVVSYRPRSSRAIIRVRGEALCVVYTLLALSLQHIGSDTGCIVIPLRTSGLISRLRHRYLKRRNSSAL